MQIELYMFKSDRGQKFKIIFKVFPENRAETSGSEADLEKFNFLLIPFGCSFDDTSHLKQGDIISFTLKDMRPIVRKRGTHFTLVAAGRCRDGIVRADLHTIYNKNYVGTTPAIAEDTGYYT
jgi:hypothetical protein